MDSAALVSVVQFLDISPSDQHSSDTTLFDALATYFDELIQHDFNKLLALLYRMDVSEAKVRYNLANPNPQESAGVMLAHLFVEREMEKRKWRERFKNGNL